MKFVELTEEEFRSFADNHEQESFFQTVEVAKLRESYGSKIYYLGVKKVKILAAAMFSVTKTFRGKYTFYAPRGFLMDYHDKDLLVFFTNNLKEYCKKRNGLMIKIDPNVIYRVRGNDGSILEDNYTDDESINNLKKSIGYKHFGFNTDIVNTQSRWNFRVELNKPYEELKKEFSKSTRKNVEATYRKGVQVRKGTIKDLESMEEILIKTAERKNFNYRSLEYYTRMYNLLGDKMQIYLAYLNPEVYLNSSLELLHKEEENNKVIASKMERDNVGNKLINQKNTSDKLLEKYREEVSQAEEFKKKNPKGKDIGVLISLKSGLEYLTLYSGILIEYKKFTPKYAMYNEHILDAYKYKIPYVDFYGISGIFDPKDENYGMYEFKRGFGGNVIELIGEFTYPISPLYYIYTTLRKVKMFLKDHKN